MTAAVRSLCPCNCCLVRVQLLQHARGYPWCNCNTASVDQRCDCLACTRVLSPAGETLTT